MATGSPRTGLVACYAAGFFSLGQVQMAALLIPLWGLELGAGAGLIGLMIGSRSLLPTVFAIHAGSIMDALGARRVLIWLAVAHCLLWLAFPLLGSVWWVVVLQLAAGFVQSTAWAGAQTQVVQVARADPTAAGRFSFAANLGSFVGPLLVGVAWDLGGQWGAFGLMALWTLGLLAAAYASPIASRRQGNRPTTFRSLLMPRLSDYTEALSLLVRPLVAIMALATFVRIAVVGIQSSFYPVYLELQQISATAIGLLVGAAALSAGFGSLFAGRTMRSFNHGTVLVLSVALTVISISVTPLLPGYASLMLFALLMGAGIGLSLAAVMTVTSSAVGPENQGRGVGLRSTTNNLSLLLVPVVMGAIVEATGLEKSFYWVGAGLGFFVLLIYVVSRAEMNTRPK